MKRIRHYFGLYTVKELTDFGNYLLNSRRTFKGHEQLRWVVTHPDFCNWLDEKDEE
jgi:hypothetical protein